jgi:uncharacterized protein (DUF2141 family)
MTFSKHVLWFLLPLVTLSCARVSNPTGGPMDTIPPILINAIPAHEQINFKGQSLELNFNELVTLSNPKEQLIITPTIGKDYKVEARQKKILVTFGQPLADSTTYTFNFRDAVQDVTEKNPARNLKIAFSTGTYIDSMSVEGLAFHAINQKEMKDVTVALQPYNDTFNIFTDPATYFTRTDEKGIFKLDNLKPGLYNLYAIADQNKNLIVDSKSEAYGFKSDSILLDENKKGLVLNLLKLDLRPLKITSARPYNTYLNIKSSKNLKDFTVEATQDSGTVYTTFGEDRANIVLYNSFPGKDSVQLRAILTDSVGNQFDSTFYGKFPTRDVTPEKFTADMKTHSVLADKGHIEFTVKFSKPIKTINFDSITYAIDSAHQVTFEQTHTSYEPTERILTFARNFDATWLKEPEPDLTKTPAQSQPNVKKEARKSAPKIKNRLRLGKGAFISVENDSSVAIQQTVNPLHFDDLGVIIAETRVPAAQVVIQLLTKSKTVTREAVHKQNAAFDNLPPDEYLLRIILDKNGNGVWDPGNYLKGQEPEDIRYWKDEKGVREIKLKANFELGPLLITY